MPEIQKAYTSTTNPIYSPSHGGDGASTSEIQEERQPQNLERSHALTGLQRRTVPAIAATFVRSPDSQTHLLSTRTSPSSPMSHHVMAARLHHLVKASMGGVEDLSPDVEARLVENVAVLLEKGFDTPEKVQKLLKQAWRHDAGIAVVGLGLTGNAGYAIGMELANEKLVAMLPPHILRSAPAVGMMVGLGVGGLDVAISVMGSATMKPLLYNGVEGNAHLPASIKVPTGNDAIMDSMKLATAANFLKNAPRMAAPAIQAAFEHRFDGVTNSSISRLTADRVDVALDAGLGFAAAAAVQYKKLMGVTGYDARMLLRDDLGAVIDKMNRSYTESAIDAAKGAGAALMSPAVPLAVTATIGFFISELFAANTMIDTAGHMPLGSHGHLPPDRADWSVMTGKRASSVALMALMTATIEIGAPIVGAAAQAATEGIVAGAGKAKEKIGGMATSAASFINQSAGKLPDIGGWVAHKLGLQAQDGEEEWHDVEMGEVVAPSLRHNVRFEDAQS
ncbi:hypothetical protein [Ideonella sp. YS5]|uniref:hypothetical protein n=1 Tax=Ideonella sp. YS5 TaxID=3453714 RepID=UPI003EEE4156